MQPNSPLAYSTAVISVWEGVALLFGGAAVLLLLVASGQYLFPMMLSLQDWLERRFG